MQTVETLNEGLKRAYRITIPAKDIDALVDKELKSIAPQVRMPGFRPGKVPANLVRKMHGPALEQQALQSAVQDGVQQLIDRAEDPPGDAAARSRSRKAAPARTRSSRSRSRRCPTCPRPKIDGLKIERLTRRADRRGDRRRRGPARRGPEELRSGPGQAQGARRATSSSWIIEGKVDGEPFEGGKGEGMSVELGSGRLIPGFEDQLIGAKANDQLTVSVTFPRRL